MLRNISIFTFLLISTAYSNTQLYANDSNDTIEIKRLIEQANIIQYKYPDSAFVYINSAIELAKQLNEKVLEIKGYITKGSIYLVKGEHSASLDFFNKSLQYSKEINHEYFISYSEMAISSVYLFISNYVLAEEHLINALEYFESTNDFSGKAGVYLNLTFIKFEQKDYYKAKEYGDKAFTNFSTVNDSLGLTRALVNLGEINYKLEKYDTALINSREAIKYAEKSGQNSMNSLIYLNIGNIYSETGRLDSAEYYYIKSLYNTISWKNSYVTAKNNQALAKLYAKQGLYGKALKMAIESYNISDKENLAQVKAESSGLIASYYNLLGDYQKAYHYKSVESTINDSLFTKDKYKVQNELETAYETKKKEQAIQSLAKEKEIEILKNKQSRSYILWLIVAITMLIIIGFIALLFFRLNAKQKHIELEQKLLRSQMNPHFIFNSISCIQDFIMNNKPLEASSYLSDFAKLMRSILNNSAAEFISLAEEIDTLKHYLELQKLRFNDKLNYKIIVDECIDTEELAIPPMLSQPFIENAIIHGISKKQDGTGNVTIEFRELNKFLYLNIVDDGVGINSDKSASDKKHKSMSTIITENRISNLKRKYKKAVKFHIESTNGSSKNTGTKVNFVLPLVYMDEIEFNN